MSIASLIKKLKWLPADIIFISDMLANTVLGSNYYALFTHYGVDGNIVNSVVSVLELVRIGALLYERHHKAD